MPPTDTKEQQKAHTQKKHFDDIETIFKDEDIETIYANGFSLFVGNWCSSAYTLIMDHGEIWPQGVLGRSTRGR